MKLPSFYEANEFLIPNPINLAPKKERKLEHFENNFENFKNKVREFTLLNFKTKYKAVCSKKKPGSIF